MKTYLTATLFSFLFVQIISGQDMKSIDLPLIHGNEFVKAGHPMRNIQYIEENGEKLLYISSFSNVRTIYVYKFELEGPRYLKKIVLPEEGPHAIKGSIYGLFIMNTDKIFVQVGHGGYLIDGDGTLLTYRSHDLDYKRGDELDAFPFIYAPNPGYKIGSKAVFTSTMNAMFTLRGIGYIMDMENLKSEPIIGIKELNTKWYGDSGPMNNHYFCTMENSIYLSLPYDHTIYKFDENKNIVERRNLKSDLLGKIRPVSKNKTEMSSFRAYEHAAYNGFYGPFMYNSHTSKFYRYVYAPFKNFTKEEDAFKNRYIEVYDSQWNQVSQFEVPDKYKGDNVFTSPDGLCFLDTDKSERIDDILTFDCYKFKGKN